ncbi:MAG: alkylphosphonate utilization protein [Sulfurospirillum sp.]|nr:alkylphosphonate utilization protein [Sulfurospirillum sp.]
MENLPVCPKCSCEYTYEDGALYVCPECAHEWNKNTDETSNNFEVRDANGTLLQDGDSVSVIKDLKIKGSSAVVKVGTKIKSIKLVEADDEHNIDCKITGIGALKIAQKFVKKA